MDVPTLSYTDADGQHTVKLEIPATSLGRSPGQNIILLDPFVSRQHAVIVAEGSTYTVMDRGSSHGIYLNGERVEKAVLKSGDVLQLGSLEAPRLNFLFDGVGERRPAAATSMVTSLLSSITEFPAQGEKTPHRGPRNGAIELAAERRAAVERRRSDRRYSYYAAAIDAAIHKRGTRIRLSQPGRRDEACAWAELGRPLREEDSTISHRAIRKRSRATQSSPSATPCPTSGASAWASVMANKIRSIYCIPLRKRDAKNSECRAAGAALSR